MSDQCNCIVCSKQIDTHMGLPMGGLIATCHGNYGSSIFDPLSGASYLKFTVCDECMTVAITNSSEDNVYVEFNIGSGENKICSLLDLDD